MKPNLTFNSIITRKGIIGPTCISDIPDGWLVLVDKLITDLFAIGWDGYLEQVKEKFGGLRFYTGAVSHEMQILIGEAERISTTTCQECGGPGCTTGRGGWYATLCDKHNVSRNEVLARGQQ